MVIWYARLGGLQDATATLRMLAQQLDNLELDGLEPEVAQFLDALDALLAKASRMLPQRCIPG